MIRPDLDFFFGQHHPSWVGQHENFQTNKKLLVGISGSMDHGALRGTNVDGS